MAAKILVHRYIRLHRLATSQAVPLDIANLCIAYAMAEWIARAPPNTFMISADNMTVTNIGGATPHSLLCFGSVDSSSCSMCSWTFKVRSMCSRYVHPSARSVFIFGLVDADFSAIDRDLPKSLAIGNSGHCWRAGVESRRYVGDARYMFADGDIVSLVLDFADRDMSLQTSRSATLKQIFSNIAVDKGRRYKMAIQLINKGDSVTLLRYHTE